MPQKKISDLSNTSTISNNDLILIENSSLINNSIKFEDIYNKIELLILNKLYPIGSLYTSTTAVSPKDALGFGEWEQIKDTFLLACGDTYENGSTGGEANHTLTIEEIAGHVHSHPHYGHTFSWGDKSSTIRYNAGQMVAASATSNELTSHQNVNDHTNSTGGSQPHNNMPPYLAIYVWKRIK